MPEPTQEFNASVIESAMSRLDAATADPSTDTVAPYPKRNLGRRDYDRALTNRLEQLRTALGEKEPEATAAPALAPTLPTPRHRAPLGLGSLFITALFSAAAGATGMWLAVAPSSPTIDQEHRFADRRQTIPVPNAAPPPASPDTGHQSTNAQAMPSTLTRESPPHGPDKTATETAENEVRQLIESWRSAWSGRDIDAYLNAYSADFSSATGQSREVWAAARRKNISTRRNISVQTRDLRLESVDPRHIKAHFLQDYAAGAYRETARPKTLLLTRQDNGWKIAGEWQEAPPEAGQAKP